MLIQENKIKIRILMKKRCPSYNLSRVFFTLLIMTVFSFGFNASGINSPYDLTVNLLQHTDQVFLSGYPVSTSLKNADKGTEQYEFVKIAQKNPFFGWKVSSDNKNTLQTAYSIIVASSEKKIAMNAGDMWTSKKVGSNKSLNVYYNGKPLKPGAIYFWKVKTWDNHGLESSYSPVSSFIMADSLIDYSTARYPIQKTDKIPEIINKLSDSLTFIDFGKDGFGRLRLTLSAQKEDTIVIRMGECIEEGRINRKPGGTIRYSSYSLTLRKGVNTYIVAIHPDKRNTGAMAVKIPSCIGQITPFRYVEIEGYLGKLNKNQIIRETVNYPFDDSASYFYSSDSVLNKIWNLCKYSMKATSFAGIFVDGDRERIPYEADALINQLGFYMTSGDYSMARYTCEYLIDNATWPTEWILQNALLAWNDYNYTGNKDFLKKNYTELKAKLMLPLENKEGFISTRTGKVTNNLLESVHLSGELKDIVDWPHTGMLGVGKEEPGETDGYVFKDINTVVNAFHYRALILMNRIADILGKTEDSSEFSSAALKIKKNFNNQLWNREDKVYNDGIGTTHASLHGNMFPLSFDMVPENRKEDVLNFIKSRGMACSVYGAQFLLESIYNTDGDQYGLDLMSSTSGRSWYNMIRAGSTITMESWDNKYKPNQDWNHAWGAAPANIIPRKLMGIEPLEPGFSKIRIKPQPGSLKSAEIKVPTLRGEVKASFKNIKGKSFSMKISVPVNSTAEVWLPVISSYRDVKEDGISANYRKDGNFVVIENVGSGEHELMINK